MLFELAIIILWLIFYLILRKLNKRILHKFVLIFIGVLLYEYFTQALWDAKNLEWWAYLYLDVSWILILGWTTVIVVSMELIDLYFVNLSKINKFIAYVMLVCIVSVVIQAIIIGLGYGDYVPAVKNTFSGATVLWYVPVESLLYLPLFVTLIISFCLYWDISLQEPKLPNAEPNIKKFVKPKGKKK